MEIMIRFFDFVFHDLVFSYFTLTVVFTIPFIFVYKKENESFWKSLITFLISYYIARTLFIVF